MKATQSRVEDVINQAEGPSAPTEYLLDKIGKCDPSSTVRRAPEVCDLRKAHFVGK